MPVEWDNELLCEKELDKDDPVVSPTPLEYPNELDAFVPVPEDMPVFQPELVPVVSEVPLLVEVDVLLFVPDEDPQLPPSPNGVMLPPELLLSDVPEVSLADDPLDVECDAFVPPFVPYELLWLVLIP